MDTGKIVQKLPQKRDPSKKIQPTKKRMLEKLQWRSSRVPCEWDFIQSCCNPNTRAPYVPYSRYNNAIPRWRLGPSVFCQKVDWFRDVWRVAFFIIHRTRQLIEQLKTRAGAPKGCLSPPQLAGWPQISEISWRAKMCYDLFSARRNGALETHTHTHIQIRKGRWWWNVCWCRRYLQTKFMNMYV